MITATKGNTIPLKQFVIDIAGSVVDITDASLDLIVSKDDTTYLTKTVTTHLDPENGLTEFNVTAAETGALSVGIYDIEVTVTFPDGGFFSIVKDKLKITATTV